MEIIGFFKQITKPEYYSVRSLNSYPFYSDATAWLKLEISDYSFDFHVVFCRNEMLRNIRKIASNTLFFVETDD